MRRVVTFFVVILTALLLQTTVFADVKLLGARPELLYLVTIVMAILEGPRSGAWTGFFGGMAQDFLMNEPKGISALTLTLLGYTVGLLRTYIVTPSPLLPTVLVAAGTAAGVVFDRFVALLLGQGDVSIGYVLQAAALSGVYTALLTPILFPILRRVAEGSRTRRVVRQGAPGVMRR